MAGILADVQPVHYLPIATTVMSAIFVVTLLRRYRARRSGPHLLWWAAGVLFYGVGTALESAITLFGNSIALNKAWYIAGALLGGYPLAQGTVFLLLDRALAKALTACTLPVIAALSVAVWLSPVNAAAFEAHRPGGSILAWTWIRWMTPIVNLYAAYFLVGGAALSAWRYSWSRDSGWRAFGNGLIALGALLPGIGGAVAKAGRVEALYVGEFVGLILIWLGYAACVRHPRPGLSPSSFDSGDDPGDRREPAVGRACRSCAAPPVARAGRRKGVNGCGVRRAG